MNKFYSSFAVGVLFLAISLVSAQAQIASYTVVNTGTATTSNDAHNTADPNDVAATQSAFYASEAAAGNFKMNPTNGNDGLGTGYPFGYTISANTQYFPTSLSGAQSQGTYLTFTITPAANATVDLTGVDFSLAQFSSDFAGGTNSSTGQPYSGYTANLLSSVDNFSSSLGSMTFNANTSGTNITLGSSFSDITTPTEFRLYFYGMNDGNEAGYAYLTIADNSTFTVNGTVATPEPGTWALMLGGLGLLLFIQRRTRRS